VPVGGPELELGVAFRAELNVQPCVGWRDFETGDHLRVAPIEPFGEADNRPEQAHDAAFGFGQTAEAGVILPWEGLAMVARDEAHDLDLVRIEPAQLAVRDEVVRVLVMALVADVDPDVVQERAVLEPLALAPAEAVQRGGSIEERESVPGDLLGVGGAVPAPLGQLDHAAASHVRIAIDGANM